MSNSWDTVRLGEVLAQSKEWTKLEPEREYQQVTVRLWGQGVIERDRVKGEAIKAKGRSVVRSGQFIMSRIDARNGAFGLVPEILDAAVVSNDFPSFNVKQSKLLPEFLRWLSKTRSFIELCAKASEGSTNRVRLKVNQFLKLSIDLPPLSEQRRIVERLEHLAEKIEEARGLRGRVFGEVDALLASQEMNIWPDETLEDAPSLEAVTIYLSRGKQSKQGESDHYLVKTRHVQMGEYVPSDMTLAPSVAKKVRPEAVLQYGDVLIASSAAGCLGRVAYFDDPKRTTSVDTHISVARANRDLILPEYLYAYLRGAQGQLQLRSRERGDWQREKIGFRLTELNIGDLRRVPIPLPPISEQKQISEYIEDLYGKVDSLKHLQERARAELDALLPSILDKAFRGEL